MSFTVQQIPSNPFKHRDVLKMMDRANRDGLVMKAQTGNRPVGVIFGLECTLHPFIGCPSFNAIEKLPLAAKVAEMRRPEVRAQLLKEVPLGNDPRRLASLRAFDSIYPMGDPPEYFPTAEMKLTAIAARRGVTPLEVAYDILLENDGHSLMYHPSAGFYQNKDDECFNIMSNEHVMMGVGDGGAHMGSICDASMSTYLLTYWTRDRKGQKLSVNRAIQMLAQDTAKYIGLHDRGLVAPGYRADINVIDYDALHLHAPRAEYDLPAGGRRLDQKVDGYVATIAKGAITYRDGQHTGQLPGRLIRGAQPAPKVA